MQNCKNCELLALKNGPYLGMLKMCKWKLWYRYWPFNFNVCSWKECLSVLFHICVIVFALHCAAKCVYSVFVTGCLWMEVDLQETDTLSHFALFDFLLSLLLKMYTASTFVELYHTVRIYLGLWQTHWRLSSLYFKKLTSTHTLEYNLAPGFLYVR